MKFIEGKIPMSMLNDFIIRKSDILIYLNIVSLSRNKGYCFATNRYIANIHNISTTQVSNSISRLEKANYIITKYDKLEKNKDKRKIYLQDDDINLYYYKQMYNTGNKEMFNTSDKQIFKHNNKYSNNIKIKNMLEKGIHPSWLDYEPTSTPCTKEEREELEKLLSCYK